VEDILGRLKLPPLVSYSINPRSEEQKPIDYQTTRENSREPPGDAEHQMASAPMGSLYEVTQLNTLRTRLRRSHPSKKQHSRRTIESDIISQGLIAIEDAQELFDL